MRNVLFGLQIGISVLLIAAILLQRKGGGLGSAFGGDGAVYHARRGLEKGLFVGTVVLAILFIGGALASLFLIG